MGSRSSFERQTYNTILLVYDEQAITRPAFSQSWSKQDAPACLRCLRVFISSGSEHFLLSMLDEETKTPQQNRHFLTVKKCRFCLVQEMNGRIGMRIQVEKEAICEKIVSIQMRGVHRVLVNAL